MKVAQKFWTTETLIIGLLIVIVILFYRDTIQWKSDRQTKLNMIALESISRIRNNDDVNFYLAMYGKDSILRHAIYYKKKQLETVK